MKNSINFSLIFLLVVCICYNSFGGDGGYSKTPGISSFNSSFQYDSIPSDSCLVTDSVFSDGYRSYCVRIDNPCGDTCLCVRIYFSDGTYLDQLVHIPDSSWIKLCFGKKIDQVAYKWAECPQCEMEGKIISRHFSRMKRQKV
jgi:hypothetical protein